MFTCQKIFNTWMHKLFPSFDSQDLDLEYLGVYYNKIMYYISTNKNIDVIKHSMDEGNKHRIIKESKIPNQHLIGTMAKKLQGHFLENFVKIM